MGGHLAGASLSLGGRFTAVRGLFTQAPVRAALGLTALLMLGHFGVISFLSPALVGNVGFAPTQLSYMYLLGGGLTLFTSPLIGRLADRYGKLRVFSLLNLAVLPGFVLITQLGQMPMLPVLIITTVLFGVLSGRNVTATTLITSVVQPGQRGAFMSLNTAVQQVTAGAAAYGAGMIVTNNAGGALLYYEWVGYVAAATTVLNFVVAQLVSADPVEKEIRDRVSLTD